MRPTPKPATALRLDVKRIAVIAVTAVALYALIPQFGALRSSYPLIQQADLSRVGLAIAAFAATYLAATATYCLLALRHLQYGRTLLVQLAGNCLNRLLPSGVGALGVSYAYLRQYGHTRSEAVAVVAINNLLGFIGNMVVIVVAWLVYGRSSLHLSHGHPVNVSLLAVIVVAVLLSGALLLVWRFQTVVQHKISAFYHQLLSYRQHPWRLIAALLSSMLLTVANAACLMACAAALHVNITGSEALLVLTLGVGAATVVPTPGGIGGLEAGVWAGLVSTGISPARSLATVLLYRLINYWLAVIIGACALVICIRHKLIQMG